MPDYKSMYKSDLADLAGVSMSTFRRWLKSSKKELGKYGCKKRGKILTPGAVKYLCEKYVISLNKGVK